ncbi:hypothetical protein Ahy_B10g104279 isoform A [Arachis hypogaea]|uniref:Protein kinase domain-containing protein n=1 Tax=Arachis hypogaea TaxID=3818 RepID=A0A444X550_ARAHY|nr:hypothetical protein Ahy_B10g104279 isoform A [Arachis hypogaea]
MAGKKAAPVAEEDDARSKYGEMMEMKMVVQHKDLKEIVETIKESFDKAAVAGDQVSEMLQINQAQLDRSFKQLRNALVASVSLGQQQKQHDDVDEKEKCRWKWRLQEKKPSPNRLPPSLHPSIRRIVDHNASLPPPPSATPLSCPANLPSFSRNRGGGTFLVTKSRVPTAALFSAVRVKDIILKRKIGKGSFSAVWRAEHRGTGEEVAVKQVFLSKLSPRLKSSFHCELNFLSSVNHPNIVRLLDFFQYDGCAYLVMEFCAGGNLASYIRSHGRVQQQTARRFMQQLGSGMKILQSYGIIHRDLKPESKAKMKNV